MGPDTQPSATPAIPRRRFLRWLVGFSAFSSLTMIAAPVVAFLVPPKSSGGASGGKVLAGTVADIPLGQGKVVAMGSKPAIVVNTAQGVEAYSAICTHLGCIVLFDDTNGTILCPCHDGRFSPASGAVLSGPPPAPLPRITVSVEGDDIYLVPG
ncbi:MAG: Rieske (2Fe-2S) protein [Chloroflexota bacterium]